MPVQSLGLCLLYQGPAQHHENKPQISLLWGKGDNAANTPYLSGMCFLFFYIPFPLVWPHFQVNALEQCEHSPTDILPRKEEFFSPKHFSKVSGFILNGPFWVTWASLL